MKRMVDDLLVVRASTLVANGDIRRDAVTALIRFGDGDGVEYRVGVRIMRFPGGGFGRGSYARGAAAAPSGCVCSMVCRLASSALGRLA